jgi:3-oxoacyl-[acyl-carrier protein] reductase
MDISGKKLVITGGANGIGAVTAARCIELGAQVAIIDLDENGLAIMTQKYPSVKTSCTDISNAPAAASAIDSLWDALGGIDILVNNASVIKNSMLASFGPGGVSAHSVELWDTVISADLNSVFYVTMPVAKRMVQNRTKGLIINVSSICAAGNAGQSAYSAAKAGVNALTVAWAKELGLLGIRVAGVAPGYTDTERTRTSMGESVLADWKSKTPIRRLGKPVEIASAIEFIIQNDFINGTILEVNGGLRL